MTIFVSTMRTLNRQLLASTPKKYTLKTNFSPRKSPFLDLDINITSDQFINKVYKKQEDFYFDIVNLPI